MMRMDSRMMLPDLKKKTREQKKKKKKKSRHQQLTPSF